MSLKLIVNAEDLPLGALIASELINTRKKGEIGVEFSKQLKSPVNAQLLVDGKVVCESSTDVGRFLARTIDTDLYGGDSSIERTQVDSWISLSLGPLATKKSKDSTLDQLDKALVTKTWLVSKQLTLADIFIFSSLKSQFYTPASSHCNISRWYKEMASLPAVQKYSSLIKEKASRPVKNPREGTPTEGRKQEGKFIELPGAEEGKVIVRFPPEASGFLHIGHAKAALLNAYYAENFKGQLIMRFDDTNPAKETVEFEQAILQDLQMLEIKPDRFTHSSDYFDLMLKYCDQLIREGNAFVDDTPGELMREQREKRLPSNNRGNSVEKNLELWGEMQRGTKRGQECCVRAKIDHESTNGCMRDPTIYRCKPEPHPRTGTKYKVYPTYDFACPIVDAVENVTHTLRTTEYHDRDDQFFWFIEALKLRRPYIWSYSRLNMTNTVLSKRKLTWFVTEGLVDGWDDPRFPTVRGILRRGMTVEGLKQFIIAQGSSRSVVFMEWDKIWSFNKKVIDPVAIRYTALNEDELIPVHVSGATESILTVQNHPKDPSKGTKQVKTGPLVLIERTDAETLKEGQNATFINWGNLMIESIKKENNVITSVNAKLNLDNKDFKNTIKLTWLTAQSGSKGVSTDESLNCYAVYFDHIISKPVLGKDDDFKDFVAKDTRKEVKLVGEFELKRVKKGEIIQLQRKGFFRCDVPYEPATGFSSCEQPLILFHIPDGHLMSPMTASSASSTTKKSVAIEKPEQKDLREIVKSIDRQRNKVCDLKALKSEKSVIETAVKQLLALKAEYKQVVGSDWTPWITLPAPAPAPASSSASASASASSSKDLGEIIKYIEARGNRIRDLKASKCPKFIIETEVKQLLALKAEYKKVAGSDWKPGVTAPSPASASSASAPASSSKHLGAIMKNIVAQVNKIHDLKASKCEKSVIETEVTQLLSLKAEYNQVAASDWQPGVTAPASSSAFAPAPCSKDLREITRSIDAQRNKICDLRALKSEKSVIEAAVKQLLALKAEYKQVVGSDWKPWITPPAPAPAPASSSASASASSSKDLGEIIKYIEARGNRIRDLKASKSPKFIIEIELKQLLALKAEYKKVAGSDWTPGVTAPAPASSSTSVKDPKDLLSLYNKVTVQGDKIRNLKAEKADKKIIEEEVKLLVTMKGEYKEASGKDWKPNEAPQSSPSSSASPTNPEDLSKKIKEQSDKIEEQNKVLSSLKSQFKSATGKEWSSSPASASAPNSPDEISQKIQSQGDKVRKLKSEKSDKQSIDEAIKQLLSLKSEYKNKTGVEWKPTADVKSSEKPVSTKADEISQKIADQGDKVRQLKSSKAEKSVIDEAVKVLLNLKNEYKTSTGDDWKPAVEPSKKSAKPAEKLESTKSKEEKKEPMAKTGTRLGLEAKKSENLPDWFSQVITKGEMIEYSDISGCYILRPWSFSIWETIRDFFDSEIKKLGVENSAFPMFVSKAALEREKDHIADFAPEVAWVTRSGDSELAEPIAIRPTSETVMYPFYAKWLKSHRDLPLKLNQWNSVVRWEFKHPQPFLRTREFLWQEGHSAFLTKPEADEEVLTILELYAKIYEDFLAIPVVRGRKTEKEKFAGGDYTTTVEAFVSASGRAIQGATSHHLGQNFSKMFEILVQGEEEGSEKTFVYQNSWGITTRTIGVMVMVHGDDKGLVLPPKVASVQAVVVPCGITATTSVEERERLMEECRRLEQELKVGGVVRVKGDYRENYSPGWKFNHWELKGVPVRIEVGFKDLEKGEVTLVRRDNSAKVTAKRSTALESVKQLLEDIHKNMFAKANSELQGHIKQTNDWSDFCKLLDQKNLLLSPFCGESSCEDMIKADSTRSDDEEPGAPSMGAKGLCIPFDQPKVSLDSLKCVHPKCSMKPKFYTLFGRSY